MLVLSRKLGEVVVIGDDITVTILEVQGSRVKLGFTAPGQMPIRREEIHPAKLRAALSRIEPCGLALTHV
jgi:carbon storage regulator